MAPEPFYAAHALRLLDSGYEPVPITPGSKACYVEGWRTMAIDRPRVAGWAANGHAGHGVGLRTARSPAVDIDIRDAEMAEKVESWCMEHIGFAPIRIGQAPKRLLLYRSESPMTKRSATWVTPDGETHKVEILADGQQFVAFAVHPDTGQPFTWPGGDSPLTVGRDDLPLITPDDVTALLDAFGQMARDAGWAPYRRSAPPSAVVPVGADDWVPTTPVRIDDEELRRLLMAVKTFDDYDGWIGVGMALHHHYAGSGDGLSLWHDWSAQSDKYDAEVVDKMWRAMRDDPSRNLRTVRSIIKEGRAALAAQKDQRATSYRESFASAADMAALRRVAEAVASDHALDTVDREAMVGALRTAWKRIEHSTLQMPLARKLVTPAAPADVPTPNWMKGWVYLTQDDTFYHLGRGERVTTAGFNAKHDRYMLTDEDREEGKETPRVSASTHALNAVKITTADHLCYLPGEEPLFWINGRHVVNSYRRDGIPEVPEEWTQDERDDVAAVERHFRELLPDPRERELLLSVFAYVVQTGKRVNWAVFLQGTEGDGKSFLTSLMGAVLGGGNVKTIHARSLMEQWNDWAAGSQIAVVEEVKLHGHNRHDVLNTVKPLITNHIVSMRVKHLSHFEVPNTQTYLLLSNYVDAMPIGDNDSRYFVLQSRFQSKGQIEAFKAANPGYYERLFGAVERSAGALRGWLLDLPLHAEFNPRTRAPWSRAHDYVSSMSASDEAQALADTLAQSADTPDLSDEFLEQGALTERTVAITGRVVPARLVQQWLSGQGYTRVLSNRLHGGKVLTVWTRFPAMYEGNDGNVSIPRVLARADEAAGE